MNYSSIGDWWNLLQSHFSDCVEWQRLSELLPAPCNTAASSVATPPGDDVARYAAAGVRLLKEAAPLDGRLAESYSTSWWLSQCLKKFRLGCTVSEAKTCDGFDYRNSCARTLAIPIRHQRRMRELLARALPAVDDSDVDGRFGPGAVFEKLDSFEKWGALSRFSYDADTMQLHSDTIGDEQTKTLCSRLQCVPKNYDKLRLITVEPAENSFGQQWVRSVLLKSVHAGCLRGGCMDQGYQDDPALAQRRRCLQASLTARDATLDLDNASDSISWDQVVSVFPTWVVSLLERFRTPTYVRDSKGKPLELFIYAGMGNATTFVVETLMFWACVTSVCEWLGDYRPVTVFGDDIICGNSSANHPLFIDELKKFGFSVNNMKSGWSVVPGFREACGVVCHSGFQLHQLIRINGFSQQDEGGLIDLCSLSNRLWGHDITSYSEHDVYSGGEDDYSDVGPLQVAGCRALTGRLISHLLLSDALSEQLIALGVPNLRNPLAQDGVWISNPNRPVTELPPDRVRYLTDRREDKPVYHELEYKVVVRLPKFRVRKRRHLSPSEGLGVLSGQLGHLSIDQGKTCVRIPIRECDYDRRWAISP